MRKLFLLVCISVLGLSGCNSGGSGDSDDKSAQPEKVQVDTQKQDLANIYFNYQIDQNTRTCQASFHNANRPQQTFELSKPSDNIFCNGQEMEMQTSTDGRHTYKVKLDQAPEDGKYVVTFQRDSQTYQSTVLQASKPQLVRPTSGSEIDSNQAPIVEWEAKKDLLINFNLNAYQGGYSEPVWEKSLVGSNTENSIQIDKATMSQIPDHANYLEIQATSYQIGKLPDEISGTLMLTRTESYSYRIQ